MQRRIANLKPEEEAQYWRGLDALASDLKAFIPQWLGRNRGSVNQRFCDVIEALPQTLIAARTGSADLWPALPCRARANDGRELPCVYLIPERLEHEHHRVSPAPQLGAAMRLGELRRLEHASLLLPAHIAQGMAICRAAWPASNSASGSGAASGAVRLSALLRLEDGSAVEVRCPEGPLDFAQCQASSAWAEMLTQACGVEAPGRDLEGAEVMELSLPAEPVLVWL